MAASIRAVQAAIAVVNVLIFALVFTSVWPFPSGDFDVNLPSASEVQWAYEAGEVTVSAPYSIDNGGFYDVSDLVISYDVRNYTNAPVHSGEIDIGTLPAGQVTSDTIDFSFPLLEMYDSGDTWMVFNDDFLNFEVEVSCYYTMKLVHFYAEYKVSVPWDALIREAAIDGASSEDGQLLIDYHVITSELLSGPAYVTAYLYNGTDLLSNESGTVALGGYHAGTLAFDLPLSAVPDRMVLTVQAYEFSVTETVAFDPGWLA
ncbi:MAG: hypothetical protein QG582_8 [Candidatus Thermoplasmatota archaeon]|nr:hypothetical protein [Candidatus Thermoplasmatota archaeon]